MPNGSAHHPREATPSRDPRLRNRFPSSNGHESSAVPEQAPFLSPQPAVQANGTAPAVQQHMKSGIEVLSEVAAGHAGLGSNGGPETVGQMVPSPFSEAELDADALSKQMGALGDSLVEEASCASLYGECAFRHWWCEQSLLQICVLQQSPQVVACSCVLVNAMLGSMPACLRVAAAC